MPYESFFLQKHLELCLHQHLNHLVDLEGMGQLVISAWTRTPSWNYFVPNSDKRYSIEKCVRTGEKAMERVGRVPCFYIIEELGHDQLVQHLLERGYAAKDKEIWWVRDLDGTPEIPPQSEIFHISDGTRDEVEKFVQAYQKGWEDLPPEYSQQLFLTMSSNVSNAHFYYLELDNSVTGIGTSIVDDQYAGLYGLAILPEFRRMGFGSVLLQNELSHVASLGSRVVFFQSDEETGDFYVKNGFDNRFSASLYLKPQEV